MSPNVPSGDFATAEIRVTLTVYGRRMGLHGAFIYRGRGRFTDLGAERQAMTRNQRDLDEDEEDCTDNDKSLIESITDCLGGEDSGVDRR